MEVLIVLLFLLLMATVVAVVIAHFSRQDHQVHPPAVRALNAGDEVSLLSIQMARLVDHWVHDDMVSCTMTQESKREAQELLARYYGRHA